MTVEGNWRAFSFAMLGILFVLWFTFFPPVSFMGSHGQTAMLPTAEDPQVLYTPEHVVVVLVADKSSTGWVSNHGRINETKYPRDQFLRKISRLKPPPRARALLKADARLSFSEVQSVAQALFAAGYQNVFLAARTDREFVIGPLSAEWRRKHVVD